MSKPGMSKAEQRELRRQELRADMEARTERAFRSAPSWRTRLRRRSLVGAVGLIIAATIVWVHLVPGQLFVPFLGMLAGCLVLIALRILTRGVAERADSSLDEHDRRLRDAAVRRAFVLAGSIPVALLLYVAFTQGMPDLGDRLIGLLVTATWAGGFAPTLALAWTLPDDDPEDLA